MRRKEIPQDVIGGGACRGIEIWVVHCVARCQLTRVPGVSSVKEPIKPHLGATLATGCVLEEEAGRVPQETGAE